MRSHVILATCLILVACGEAPEEPSSADAPMEAGNAVEEASDSLTPAQRNARRSAEGYLSMKGFSKKGLIEQLSSDAGDGYAVADATAAVESLTVDWNEQAARSAKDYLNMMGFSCKGLIEQLSSSAGDGFTPSEAEYGAKEAGAC